MVKVIATTLVGIEDIVAIELKEFACQKIEKIADGRILFGVEEKRLNKLSCLRGINAVYTLFGNFNFSNEKEIYNQANQIKFKLNGTFAVRCWHNDKEVSSKDIERNVGEIIYNKGYKVDLKAPDNIVVVDIVKNKCFVGLKIFDSLCKRKYRVKVNNQGVNACLAHALLRIAGYKSSSTLIDPFCKDGVIIIEAALFKKGKVYGIDRTLGNVKASRINAKLANVFNKINIENYDIEWLDTKFKENEINLIITSPPFISNKMGKRDIDFINKEYNELFHQARFVLKKKGKLVFVSPKSDLLKKYAGDNYDVFKFVEERKVFVGGMEYFMLIYERV